ncbi:protein activator of alkane oxidation PraB [Brevundimonas sp.]|uniref:protein activator of alkane oxidation PraB n=1 Tax=Brevundimonas sp. TaxID=1871086 RepID=UPI003F706956
MLKKISAAVLSVALLGVAGHASAQVNSATGTFSVRGNLTMSQSTTRICDVTLNITMTGPVATSGQVTSATFAPGQTGCGFPISPRNIPWTVTYVGPGAIRITGVGANTLFGYCDNGVIDVAWNNTAPGSGTATVAPPFPGTTSIPSVPYPTATCNITGPVTVISGGPVSVT